MMVALALSNEALFCCLYLGPFVNNFFNLLCFYDMQVASNYIL